MADAGGWRSRRRRRRGIGSRSARPGCRPHRRSPAARPAPRASTPATGARDRPMTRATISAPPFDVGASQESVTLDRVTSDRSSWCRRERLRGTALRDNPEAVISTGAQTAHRERRVNVPLDLGGRFDRHATFEDRLLAANDRRIGQR